jgi:hypothetical protein
VRRYASLRCCGGKPRERLYAEGLGPQRCAEPRAAVTEGLEAAQNQPGPVRGPSEQQHDIYKGNAEVGSMQRPGPQAP